MVLLLDGALHTAPLYSPQRILDVGTGTGIWAVEMSVACPAPFPILVTDILPSRAVKYPQARVVGMDLRLVVATPPIGAPALVY